MVVPTVGHGRQSGASGETDSCSVGPGSSVCGGAQKPRKEERNGQKIAARPEKRALRRAENLEQRFFPQPLKPRHPLTLTEGFQPLKLQGLKPHTLPTTYAGARTKRSTTNKGTRLSQKREKTKLKSPTRRTVRQTGQVQTTLVCQARRTGLM